MSIVPTCNSSSLLAAAAEAVIMIVKAMVERTTIMVSRDPPVYARDNPYLH